MSVPIAIRAGAAGGKWLAKRYGPRLMGMAGAAMTGMARRRFGGQGSAKRFKKGAKSGKPLTNQNDVQLMYRRRRAPRALRFRARKFALRVKKVINSTLADKNFRRINTQSVTSAFNSQNVFSVSMYSQAGNVGSDNDISVIANALGPVTSLAGAYQFRSAVLDVTIAADDGNLGACWLDCFYVMCRQDVTAADALSIDLDFINSMNVQSFPAVGQHINYGVTPFQASRFCQNWIITKVQRLKINPGENVSLDIRDSRFHRFGVNDAQAGGFALKNVTKGILFVLAGAPDIGTGQATAATVHLNWTRLYSSQIISPNQSTYATV